MITDANGNMVTGVDIDTGKSYITYKPYGEVNRTNSGGPDIFRYKYTGQEEDPETGLYYYKARYYDPAIGRFIQADTVINPESPFGMNQYMYVEGNPVMYVDPSGNRATPGNLAGIGAFIVGNGLCGFSCGAILGAGAGVYKNYTGGGKSRTKKPNELGALSALFYNYIKNSSNGDTNKELEKHYTLFLYYNYQKSIGQPTFLNTGSRKSLEIGLFLAAQNGMIDNKEAVGVYYLMTDGVKVPKKGVDQASYWHDQYAGSSPLGHKKKKNQYHPFHQDAKKGNNRWIKNAWQRAGGPGDIAAAALGTVLFKVANVVNGVIHIKPQKYSVKYARYQGLKPCRKGCNIGSF
jgi:RHS repeat-associated protein